MKNEGVRERERENARLGALGHLCMCERMNSFL